MGKKLSVPLLEIALCFQNERCEDESPLYFLKSRHVLRLVAGINTA